MVLPGRIELPTSALPRMRSTTELRQHIREVHAAEPRLRRGGGYGGGGEGLSRQGCRGYANAVDKTAADMKAERLAAALRANLLKRKGRERAVAADDLSSPPNSPAPPRSPP